MMIFTECSLWSWWLTIGTKAEIAPPLAVEGVVYIEQTGSIKYQSLPVCRVFDVLF